MMVASFATFTVVALVALVTGAIKDVGEGVVLAGAVLAALVYIVALLRKGARALDRLDKLPGEVSGLKQSMSDAEERHEAAHGEMLRAVEAVRSQVSDLDGRLDRIEHRSDVELNHAQAIARELDVPVRRGST